MELQSETNYFSVFIFISLWGDKDHNEFLFQTSVHLSHLLSSHTSVFCRCCLLPSPTVTGCFSKWSKILHVIFQISGFGSR